MAASVAKAAAALGLFALHGVEASPASGLGPDARRLQSFDSNAAARQIDYSNPNYGRDHTPGGDWDLMEQVQSGKAYKSADYERSLQGLTAEFTGLWLPTGVAQDGQGHVIISQKTGLVVIFDVATAGYFGAGGRVLIDIQSDVANYGDHGLTHVVYHEGYLWMTYSRETPGIGDNCLDDGAMDGRPLSQVNGCEVHGRVVRFPYDAATGQVTGGQEVIVEGRNNKIICGQFATHGATSIIVGPDNALYFSAGDGASYQGPDVGQFGNNPCNDPPGYLGGFRTQDPNRLGGKITRLDPKTLEYRIYATGFRNPFRLTSWNGRIFESDTGWYNIEEFNEIFEGKNYGWPCYEGNILQVDYNNFKHPVCEWLKSGGGGGNTVPIHFYHHPPGAAGNVMSISAIAGYNGRLWFGDFTTSEIYSLDAQGGDKQLVLRDCYPVGLYESPVGLLYIDYTRGAVRSLPAAGAPLPSPSSTAATPWVKIIPQQEGWTVGGGDLSYWADGQKGGREGNNFQWSVTYLQCDWPGSTSCKAANLFDRNDKQMLTISSPTIPVTMEITIKRWTFAGSVQTDGIQIVNNGGTLCTCPGTRVWVEPGQLSNSAGQPGPSASPGAGTGGGSGGGGGGGGTTGGGGDGTSGGGSGDSVTSKSGIGAGAIGGITAAVAVVVIGAVLAAAFYTGFLHRIGLIRRKGPNSNNANNAGQSASSSTAGNGTAANNRSSRNGNSSNAGTADPNNRGVEMQGNNSRANTNANASTAAAASAAASAPVAASAVSELASRRPSFPSLAPVHVRSSESSNQAAAAPRRTPADKAATAGAASAKSGNSANAEGEGNSTGISRRSATNRAAGNTPQGERRV